VVAASALLRLGTTLDAGGNAASILPAALEAGVRIVHRVSASIVGILALAALVLAWRARPVPGERLAALVAIAALTLLLAGIGRYTPGYRFVPVTVLNSVAGVALACAFVWLRGEALRRGAERDRVVALAAGLALLGLLAELKFGTAASASAMHGLPGAFEPLHVALGPVALGVAVFAAALRQRGSPSRRLRAAIAALAAAQMAFGMTLAAMGSARGMPAAWIHAMLGCAIAMALAALAARGR
jgi:hypothetical protein